MSDSRTTDFLPDVELLDLLEDDPLSACRALDAMLLNEDRVAAWCDFQMALRVSADMPEHVSDAIIAKGVAAAFRNKEITVTDIHDLLENPARLQVIHLRLVRGIDDVLHESSSLDDPPIVRRKRSLSGKMRTLFGSPQGLAAAALFSVFMFSTVGYAIINHLSYDEKQHIQLFAGIVGPAREVATTESTPGYTTITVGEAQVRLPQANEPQVEATGFIGTGDTLAVSQIIHPLIVHGADIRRIQVVTTRELESTTNTAAGMSEINIGGPSVSSRFLALMSQIHGVADPQFPSGLSSGFRFRIRPAGRQNAFATVADKKVDGHWKLGIEDVRTGQLCPVNFDGNEAGRIDAALVVRSRLDERELLFVAGYEMTGTLAAAKLLSKPNPIVTRFNQVFQRDGHAEMVLQIRPGTDEAVLYQFDGIENPRGKDVN